MYCPQCGTESGSGLQYCRSCGANLKVVGKALTLSEAIARSDRGPLPKIKEMVKSFKVEHVTDEVSRALDRMNTAILQTSATGIGGPSWWRRHKKTAEERREKNIVKGTVSLFTGVGLTIFLYYFSAALILKLPPDVVSRIPFELEPVVRILWLLGLIPVLSGLGHIVAGLLIRPAKLSNNANIISPVSIRDSYLEPTNPESSAVVEPLVRGPSRNVPASVTEQTTNLLTPPD
jgi:hypothetical protein